MNVSFAHLPSHSCTALLQNCHGCKRFCSTTAFKHNTESTENVVQLQESQQSYINMLLVSPLREEGLPSHLLRLLLQVVPGKKRQPARSKPHSFATGGECNATDEFVWIYSGIAVLRINCRENCLQKFSEENIGQNLALAEKMCEAQNPEIKAKTPWKCHCSLLLSYLQNLCCCPFSETR